MKERKGNKVLKQIFKIVACGSAIITVGSFISDIATDPVFGIETRTFAEYSLRAISAGLDSIVPLGIGAYAVKKKIFSPT